MLLYLALCVDNSVQFSADKVIEKQFESNLQSKLIINFVEDTEHFLGTEIDWSYNDDGSVECFMSQVAHANAIIKPMKPT